MCLVDALETSYSVDANANAKKRFSTRTRIEPERPSKELVATWWQAPAMAYPPASLSTSQSSDVSWLHETKVEISASNFIASQGLMDNSSIEGQSGSLRNHITWPICCLAGSVEGFATRPAVSYALQRTIICR